MEDVGYPCLQFVFGDETLMCFSMAGAAQTYQVVFRIRPFTTANAFFLNMMGVINLGREAPLTSEIVLFSYTAGLNKYFLVIYH